MTVLSLFVRARSGHKTCTKCEQPKRVSCFAKNPGTKDGLEHKCKECRKAYWQEYISKKGNRDSHRLRSAKRMKRKRQEILEFHKLQKEKPCLDCGDSHPYYVMHFDHLDPSKKTDCVSRLKAIGVTPERLLEEIDKCDLICGNCHAYRTHKRLMESSN